MPGQQHRRSNVPIRHRQGCLHFCAPSVAATARSEVIHGVSLEVPSDGVAAVMGHNGAGKTTFLRAAVGLLKCTAGKVVFNGDDITRCGPARGWLAGRQMCRRASSPSGS